MHGRIAHYTLSYRFLLLLGRRHMLNVTWERKDLSFNNQGFLSSPSMVIIALDRERLWDKVVEMRHSQSTFINLNITNLSIRMKSITNIMGLQAVKTNDIFMVNTRVTGLRDF